MSVDGRFLTGSTMGHVVRMTMTGATGITFVFLVDATNLFWVSLLGDARLVAAIGFAFLLSGPVGEPVSAVILAFAPGGVSEMSLVALSLHLSAVFVTMHHLVRIILAVMAARLGQRLAGI